MLTSSSVSWYHEGRQEISWCRNAKYLASKQACSYFRIYQHCSCNSGVGFTRMSSRKRQQSYPVACGLFDHGRSIDPNDSVTNFPKITIQATLPSMHFWPFASCWSSEIPSVGSFRSVARLIPLFSGKVFSSFLPCWDWGTGLGPAKGVRKQLWASRKTHKDLQKLKAVNRLRIEWFPYLFNLSVKESIFQLAASWWCWRVVSMHRWTGPPVVPVHMCFTIVMANRNILHWKAKISCKSKVSIWSFWPLKILRYTSDAHRITKNWPVAFRLLSLLILHPLLALKLYPLVTLRCRYQKGFLKMSFLLVVGWGSFSTLDLRGACSAHFPTCRLVHE